MTEEIINSVLAEIKRLGSPTLGEINEGIKLPLLDVQKTLQLLDAEKLVHKYFTGNDWHYELVEDSGHPKRHQ